MTGSSTINIVANNNQLQTSKTEIDNGVDNKKLDVLVNITQQKFENQHYINSI